MIRAQVDSAMKTDVTVDLSSSMLTAIETEIAVGHYGSLGELVAEALEAWLEQRAGDAERIADIHARIARSLEDPRPPISLDEAFGRVEALHATRVKSDTDSAA